MKKKEVEAPLMSLDKVSLSYPTGAKPFEALKEVDLNINRGEFLGITGKSGAGKTTLLNMISGVSDPSSGTINYFPGKNGAGPSAPLPIHEMDEDAIARLGEGRYRLIKLWVSEVNGPFDAEIAKYVNANTCVLDAGCSRGDPDLPSIGRAKHAVGCDTDAAGLRANVLVRDRVLTVLETLPFRDASFDTIVCKFVVEHLAAPLETFREFWRVLRPGGVLAVLTPNRLSLFTLCSQLMPFRVKQTLKAYLFGGHDEDTFPAFYRANTRSRLNALLREARFSPIELHRLAGMWAFFIFSRPLAYCIRLCEHIALHIPVVRNTSTYLMGVWQKPLAPQPCG